MDRGWIDPVRERATVDVREYLGLVDAMDAARERVELALTVPDSIIRLTGIRSDLARRPVRIVMFDEVEAYPLADDEYLGPRGIFSGAYCRPGWSARCLNPKTGLWESFRLRRRTARRQRGRARAAARRARAALA